MMDMMGGMSLLLLLALLVLAIVVGTAVYLGVRAAQPRGNQELTARETLQRRLAAGEITPEEFYERDSVLRVSGHAAAGRRR